MAAYQIIRIQLMKGKTRQQPRKKNLLRAIKNPFLEHIRMPSALLIITVRSQTHLLIKPAVCQHACGPSQKRVI